MTRPLALVDKDVIRSVRPVCAVAVRLVCCAWLAMMVGCAADQSYQAARLPVKYMAPPVENIQQVDLSRLGNLQANSQAIDRGDVLSVTISTDYTRLAATTTPVRVGEDGFAEIPQIGRVSLAGLELEEAEAVITSAGISRDVFRNPHVTVTMHRQRTNRITVIGAVRQASVVRLPRNSSTLLGALVAAGGLAEDAGANVEIRRARPRGVLPGNEPSLVASDGARLASFTSEEAQAGPRVIQVNLAEATQDDEQANRLHDGDVVVVRRRTPKPIHVIGLVRKPDKYELPVNQEVRVLDALAMAGDRTMQAADRVLIIRHLDGQEKPVRIEVSVQDAKANGTANLRLAPGDIVSVEETPVTMVLSTLRQVVRIAVGGSVAMF